METSWQLVASLVVFYIPLVQQVANLHVVIDLYQVSNLLATQKSCELVANYLATSWKLVGNPSCQPGLATSFQLVRLVGCGLNRHRVMARLVGCRRDSNPRPRCRKSGTLIVLNHTATHHTTKSQTTTVQTIQTTD